MKMVTGIAVVGLCFLLANTAAAQQGDLILKPFIGYMSPSMTDVNSNIDADIRAASELFGEPIPFAGEIGAKPIFGGQLEYHINEELFINLNIGYYSDKVSTSYTFQINNPGTVFNYEREVEQFDFIVNFHYYFGYSTWRSFNKFLAFGVGISVANAKAFTESTNPIQLIDSRGEFAGNILSGVLGVGGDVRVAKPVKLWGELGFQFGDFGELDGTIWTIDNPDGEEVITDSKFNFSGFYIRGGVAVTVAFLK